MLPSGRARAPLVLAAAALALAGCRPGASPATPTPPPAATATPLSIDAYRDRVATAAAVWTAAADARPTARTAALATVETAVGHPAAVRLRGTASARRDIVADGLALGTPAPPAASATAAEPAGLGARLAVVRDEIDAGAADRSAAREAVLDRVLADRALRDRRSPWERVVEWVTDRVKRWWGGRSLPAGTGEAALRLGQVIGWAVALAVIALTALWIARALGGLTIDARAAAGPNAPPATPTEARARAESLAARGDYREAVRQLYLAALLVLEGNGLLRADRSRTNREQLAAVGGGPALRGAMAAVVDTFDRVWYGVTVPGEATFRAYAETIHDLERLARGVAARGVASPPGAASGAATTDAAAPNPSPADAPPDAPR